MGIGNELYDPPKMEVTTRSRTGHNTNEEYRRLQYGGTSMDSFDLVSSHAVESGAYDSRLGRWERKMRETTEGKITRIFSAYAPVYSQT